MGLFKRLRHRELSAADAMACEAILIHNVFFFSKYTAHFQFVPCLQDLCLERSHQIVITWSIYQVSNSGIVPCSPVSTPPLPTSSLTPGMKKRGDCLGRLACPGCHTPAGIAQVSFGEVICEPKPETLTSAGCKHI